MRILSALSFVFGVGVLMCASPTTANAKSKSTNINEDLALDAAASSLLYHGVASLHSFDADVKNFSGHASGKNLEAAAGRVTIDVKSIDTHSNGRNKEMLRLLEAEKYPQMIFVLKSAQSLPNVTSDGRTIEDLAQRETKCLLKGDLLVRGKTAPIEGKGKCTQLAQGWKVEGEAPVNMQTYGIEPPHIAIITMDPIVTVRYNLVFKK